MSVLVEGSLWKLKSSLTGASWKRHWVSTDGVTVNQWHARMKPSAKEPPKYSLHLKDCNVSDHQGRKYCFKIAEKNSNLVLVFAVDDFDSYERWLKVLISRTGEELGNVGDGSPFPLQDEDEYEVSERDEASPVLKEESQEEEEEAPPDFILEYFKEHDLYQVRLGC